MITLNWMMFAGMTLFLLTGLITRSWLITIMSCLFALPMVLNAPDNMSRLMWGGAGVVIAVIAYSFGWSKKSQDDY